FTRSPGAGSPAVVVAVWLPGAAPVAPGAGLGFMWKAGEQLVVRIHYKKNWKLENKPASDRSTVGLYLLKSASPRAIRQIPLSAGRPIPLDEQDQRIAVRPANATSDVRVLIDSNL